MSVEYLKEAVEEARTFEGLHVVFEFNTLGVRFLISSLDRIETSGMVTWTDLELSRINPLKAKLLQCVSQVRLEMTERARRKENLADRAFEELTQSPIEGAFMP